MAVICGWCDTPTPSRAFAECEDCGSAYCKRCLTDGLCEECRALAEDPAEPDMDAPSFAETHESAWRQKRSLG